MNGRNALRNPEKSAALDRQMRGEKIKMTPFCSQDDPFLLPELVSTSVAPAGKLTDLYDFDMDSDPINAPVRPAVFAAAVQAGYGTFGTAGHVFKYEVQFAGSAPVSVFHDWGDSSWAP